MFKSHGPQVDFDFVFPRESQVQEEEKVNVVPLDPWELQEELDFQEVKDQEEPW